MSGICTQQGRYGFQRVWHKEAKTLAARYRFSPGGRVQATANPSQILVPSTLFDQSDHVPHGLFVVLSGDQRGIRRVDHNEVIHADGCNQMVAG